MPIYETSLTLCLPKKFHANCNIGVRWNPDFKKVFGRKDLTQINKLTLKTVINEQLNTKTSNKRKKNTKIRQLVHILFTVYLARQGVQRLDGALQLPLHPFPTVMRNLHVYNILLLLISYHYCHKNRNILELK